MKRLCVFIVSIAAVLASSFFTAPTAAAETTGQYYYACLWSNGYEYWLRPGEKTTKCTGAADILVYINGKHVRTVSLTTGGTTAKHLTDKQIANLWKAGDCIVAIGSGVLLIATTDGFGTVFWISAGFTAYSAHACVG